MSILIHRRIRSPDCRVRIADELAQSTPVTVIREGLLGDLGVVDLGERLADIRHQRSVLGSSDGRKPRWLEPSGSRAHAGRDLF